MREISSSHHLCLERVDKLVLVDDNLPIPWAYHPAYDQVAPQLVFNQALLLP